MYALLLLGIVLAVSPIAVRGEAWAQMEWVNVSLAIANSANPFYAPQLQMIREAADIALSHPLYTVTTSKYAPPNNDMHSYLSWAPYWNVVPPCDFSDPYYMYNCTYENKDGIFNPDIWNCTQATAMGNVSNDALSLILAAVIYHNHSFADKLIIQLRTFFINKETKMNPDLLYAQVHRGHNEPLPWVGRSIGIIDGFILPWVSMSVMILNQLSGLSKRVNTYNLLSDKEVLSLSGIVNGWTHDDAIAMSQWFEFLGGWLGSNPQGIEEETYANNHGTWYHVQSVTYPLMNNNIDGTITEINYWQTHQYQHQIIETGEQPLEANRTRPFHYRCYNIQAAKYIATIASLSSINIDLFHSKNQNNATLLTAINFILNKVLIGKDNPMDFVPLLIDTLWIYGDDQQHTYRNAIAKYNTAGVLPMSVLWKPSWIWDGYTQQTAIRDTTTDTIAATVAYS